MPEIISAKCLGCGNIIKVPAALGGKKARCPQCTNTIMIPNAASDTQFTDIISDAELPEVARDGEIVRPEEGDAPIPGQEEEEPAEEPAENRRSRGSTSVRGRVGSGPNNPRVQRSGTQPRYTGGGGGTATRKAPQSNTGMIIGIALGVVALVIVAVVFAGGSGSHSKPMDKPAGKQKDKDAEKPKKGPQYSEAEQGLINRLMDYTATVNRGDATQIQKFYSYEPDEERKVRLRIAVEIVEKKVSYEGVQIKGVNIGAGTVTFTFNGGEKTLQWKQVGDVWYLAEIPGN